MRKTKGERGREEEGKKCERRESASGDEGVEFERSEWREKCKFVRRSWIGKGKGGGAGGSWRSQCDAMRCDGDGTPKLQLFFVDCGVKAAAATEGRLRILTWSRM